MPAKRGRPKNATLQELFDLCANNFEKEQKWREDIDAWKETVTEKLEDLQTAVDAMCVDDANPKVGLSVMARCSLDFTFLDT